MIDSRVFVAFPVGLGVGEELRFIQLEPFRSVIGNELMTDSSFFVCAYCIADHHSDYKLQFGCTWG